MHFFGGNAIPKVHLPGDEEPWQVARRCDELDLCYEPRYNVTYDKDL